jgi:NDP-sugar pyrophosphorylase family protein
MIPALLLTAGLATRLRPLSHVRAKAALSVGGTTLAGRILAQLAAAGVREAILNLHHLPATLTSRIGDGSGLGLRVRYSWESPMVLGSAGGPRKALPLLNAETFLIVNGDTLTDVNLPDLIRTHQQSGALVTIAVIPNTMPELYSGLRADDHGYVTGVVPRGTSTPSFHVIGVQVAEARAFERLAENVPARSIGGLYDVLSAERPDAVRIYPCASPFLDIGTPADYVATCRTLATAETGFLERGLRVEVHPTARVRDTIAWDDVVIEAGAYLDNVVVTDGVRVPAGSRWEHAILRKAESPADAGERIIGDLAVTSLVPTP